MRQTNALKIQTFLLNRTTGLQKPHTHPQKYWMSVRLDSHVRNVVVVESGCAGADVDVVSHDVTQSNPSDWRFLALD